MAVWGNHEHVLIFFQESQTNFDNEYGGPFILWAVEPEPESAGDDE